MTPEGKAAFVAWMQSSEPQYIVLVDKGHYGGREAWDAIAQAAIAAAPPTTSEASPQCEPMSDAELAKVRAGASYSGTTIAELGRLLARLDAVTARLPIDAAAPSFDDAWRVKEAEGYQYGHDALEQVRFGWELREAYAAAPPIARLDPELAQAAIRAASPSTEQRRGWYEYECDVCGQKTSSSMVNEGTEYDGGEHCGVKMRRTGWVYASPSTGESESGEGTR